MNTTKAQYRKQKVLGFKTLQDTKTGEEIPVQMVQVEERDFSFHKVWLQHLIVALDEISNQKQKLAFWILDNLDRENQLTLTLRQISEKSGISYQTVARTMKVLQSGKMPLLVRKNGGCYVINPNIIWKGSHNTRMAVLYEYLNMGGDEKKEEE